MNNVTRLLALIEKYKVSASVEALEAIADLVDSDYESLEPILKSHGVTY